MKLKSLKLKNFLSFETLEHEFRDSPVLIQGRNLTEVDSKETNGAGKSTMEAAIAYALMATPLRKQVLDRDLIRWGEQEAEITLEIHCPVRKQTLTIYRKLSLKGSAKLELYLTPDDNKIGSAVSFSTVNDGNRYILDWIGISAEDLKSFYILNKENYRSFLSSSNTDKLALINRFIKADGLDNADEVIKRRKQPLEEALKKAEGEVLGIQGEIRAYEGQLAQERERNLEQEHQSRIAAIESQIDDTIRQYDSCEAALNSDVEKYKAALGLYNDVREKVEEAQRVWDSRTVTDFSKQKEELNDGLNDLNSDIATKTRSRAELEQKIKQASVAVSQLDIVLAGVVSCPQCGHRFNPKADMTVEDAQAEKERKETEIGNLNVQVQSVQADIDSSVEDVRMIEEELNKVRKNEDDERGRLQALENTLLNAKRDLTNASINLSRLDSIVQRDKDNLKSLSQRAEEQQKHLEEVQNEQIDSRVADYEASITLANKRLEKAQKVLDEARARVVEMEQWGQRFKDFKMSLACEQLKVIQDSANLFLERQKSELRVSVDGFKKNAKGQVKSEITVLVINGEGEYKSFWSYSGGERTRIEMALIQAFQEMINSTNPYGGLNFLMVDEVLEGTDPLGLALLFDALQDVGYPVYVISHIMNIRADIPTLTVVKENGNSYIEE